MDRRIMMSGGSWSPQSANSTAWYYAAGQYVSLNGAGVVNWNDKLAGGNDVIQATPLFQPTWEGSGGWSANKPSIRSVNQVLTSSGGGAAPIEAVFTGLNKPFTILTTCQIPSYTGTVNVCQWNGAASVTQTCDVTSGQLMSITRHTPAVNQTITASANLVGTGHVRLAYAFTGTNISMYLNTLLAASSATDVNHDSVTWTSFSVANGRDIRLTEVIAIPRALSAAEVALYYAYSLNEWGA